LPAHLDDKGAAQGFRDPARRGQNQERQRPALSLETARFAAGDPVGRWLEAQSSTNRATEAVKPCKKFFPPTGPISPAQLKPARGRPPCLSPAPRSAFAGYRFPPEVITLAVRWYLRFGLSYRDAEELLAERGIEVDHVTVYRWVQRFAPEFAQAARARQHVVGDRRHVDETYLRIGGTWHYLCRAIDQFGQVIDVYLSPRRDANAARLFFAQAIGRTRISPVEVTTDRYRLYPRVLDEMLPGGLS
jgi:hypothetical protein